MQNNILGHYFAYFYFIFYFLLIVYGSTARLLTGISHIINNKYIVLMDYEIWILILCLYSSTFLSFLKLFRIIENIYKYVLIYYEFHQ